MSLYFFSLLIKQETRTDYLPDFSETSQSTIVVYCHFPSDSYFLLAVPPAVLIKEKIVQTDFVAAFKLTEEIHL